VRGGGREVTAHTTARPPGAHSATPLQDLCIELHTHNRYKEYRTTKLHTHSSLQHTDENIIDDKIDLRKETTINANPPLNYCLYSRLHLISLF
jgi:hypothetical protein